MRIFKVFKNTINSARFIALNLLFSLTIVHAQEQKTDISLNKQEVRITSLITSFRKFEFSQALIAKSYLDTAWTLSLSMNNRAYQAEILLCYSDYFSMNGEHSKAQNVALKAMTIYQSDEHLDGMGEASNMLGKVALRSGDYQKALTFFLKASDFFKQCGNVGRLAVAYHNIGGVHYDQGDDEQALNYWKNSLQLETELADTTGIIFELNAIGSVHYARGEYEEALKIMQQSLQLAKQVNDEDHISYLLMNIGTQHQLLNHLDSAQIYYQQSLYLLKKLNDRTDLAYQYINLGRLECKRGNGHKAIAFFDSSLVIGNELNSPLIIKHAYSGLSDAHKIAANFEVALTWLDKWYALKDSINGVETKLRISEIQEKYEAEQKDKEIAKLEQQELITSTIAEKRRIWLVFTISASILLILLILVFIGRRRAKNKHRRVELEHRALRTQMNPHFIFNSLGAIQQMYMSGETDLANNYMGDFGKLMRKILDNSGKDRVSVKEELDVLRLYLELEKGRNNGMIEYKLEVDKNIDQMGTYIPPMIIQPFVENAIWHGILPKKIKGNILICLKLRKDGDALECLIEDNGVGMKANAKTKNHESKGIMITEQRLKTKINFEELNPGTRVTFNIPV